jgi:hypothetical protein
MGRALSTLSAVLACAALFVSCGGLEREASNSTGTSVQEMHAWNGYHWARTSNPFTLKVGDNMSSAWDPYLAVAVSDWSVSSVLNLQIVAGGTKPRNCRPTTGRIEACNASYGNNGWLGIAQIWVSGNHITQATAKMNDTYMNQPPYNTGPWHQFVVCQEIAHDFGLSHQDENFNNANLGSCMDYTNDPDGGPGGASQTDPSNEHPNAHDFEQLEIIYNNHLDSFNSYNMPVPGGSTDANNWGELVRGSRESGISTYVRDNGDHQVITKVIWAR